MRKRVIQSRAGKLSWIIDPVFAVTVVLLGALLYAVPWNPVFGATAAATRDARVGFLVVAPDRGFLGNE